MKALALFVVLSAVLQTAPATQTDACCIYLPEPHRVNISPELAQKMLIHKADLACPKVAMPARFTGTVVLNILIDKSGNVIRSAVISGPAMLQKPARRAVRKYKYKPYLLNNKAVEVVTTVAVVIDSYRDCHVE